MFENLAMGGNPAVWPAIAVIIVVLFGANRIPEIMKGLGSGMREFKRGREDEPAKDRTESHSPAGKEGG